MARMRLEPGARPSGRASQATRVRIGPLSLLALMVTLCLAVLAMLVFSTANATYTLANRQADAVSGYYQDERAAQEFVAGVDAVLADARAGSPAVDSAQAARAVDDSLDDLCLAARRTGGGQVAVDAAVKGDAVEARFARLGGTTLSVKLTLLDGGSYRIDSWDMTAVQNEEQPEGQLLKVD